MKKDKNAKPSWIDTFTQKFSQAYQQRLSTVFLRNKFTATATILIAAALFGFSIYTAKYLNSEMFPQDDSKTMGLTIDMEPGTTIGKNDEIVRKVADLLRQKPFFESVVSYTGMRSPMASNAALLQKESFTLAGFGCRFKPRAERTEKLSYKLVPSIRKEVEELLSSDYPGAQAVFHLESSGSSSKAPVQIRITGENLRELRKAVQTVKTALKKVPGTSDVTDNMGLPTFDLNMNFDREAMDFFELSADSLSSQLLFAMGTAQVDQAPFEGNREELALRMGFEWPSRKGLPGGPRNFNELKSILAYNQNGERISCNPLLKASLGPGESNIIHYKGIRTVTVSSQLQKKTAREVVKDLDVQLKKMTQSSQWPKECSYLIGGESEEAAEAYGNIPALLCIVLFMVIAILALQFNSFLQTGIIMGALPFSLFGVIMGFFFTGMNISFVAVVGIISLIGIAVNNAIVMVETMNSHLDDSESIVEAAIKGAGERLRPILATTVTTIIGLIPLAISSPSWKPLCYAIIFGLMASTFISLLVLPALYSLFTKKVNLSSEEPTQY